jgi:hypothetical protein
MFCSTTSFAGERQGAAREYGLFGLASCPNRVYDGLVGQLGLRNVVVPGRGVTLNHTVGSTVTV